MSSKRFAGEVIWGSCALGLGFVFSQFLLRWLFSPLLKIDALFSLFFLCCSCHLAFWSFLGVLFVVLPPAVPWCSRLWSGVRHQKRSFLTAAFHFFGSCCVCCSRLGTFGSSLPILHLPHRHSDLPFRNVWVRFFLPQHPRNLGSPI